MWPRLVWECCWNNQPESGCNGGSESSLTFVMNIESWGVYLDGDSTSRLAVTVANVFL